MKKPPFDLCAHIKADIDRYALNYDRFHSRPNAHGSFPQRAIRSDKRGKAILE